MRVLLFVPYFRWDDFHAQLHNDPSFDNDSAVIYYPSQTELHMFANLDNPSIFGEAVAFGFANFKRSVVIVAPVKIIIQVTEETALLPYKEDIVRAFREASDKPQELMDFRNEAVIEFYDACQKRFQSADVWMGI